MMLDRLTLRSEWSIVVALVYCLLLFPLSGMAYFSPFVSESLDISVEPEHTKILLTL